MFFVAYARRLLRRDPNFSFVLYCEPVYHAQVLSMLKPFGEQASVAPTGERTADAISIWIGDGDFFQQHPEQHNYPVMYQDWFRRLSAKLGVESPIKSAYDLFMEVDEIDDSHGHFDYLVINSSAQSSQWVDTAPLFDDLIRRLKGRGLRVAKTHPSSAEADFCTMDAGMTIQQLIDFSPCCKRVVGVNNAPMVATINTESFARTEAWHVCDHWTFYAYPRFFHLRSATELASYIALC